MTDVKLKYKSYIPVLETVLLCGNKTIGGW